MRLDERAAQSAIVIAETLKLKRPLVFWDLETTGIDFLNDRIVEFNFTKIHPDGGQESIESLVNPGMNIPAEASEVHKITDESVESYPQFSHFIDQISRFLYDCDLVTYNGNKFDVPLLMMEFSRNGVLFDFTKYKFIDASVIFIRQNPRTLSAAYTAYTGEILDQAHMASIDVDATISIFAKQLETHDIPKTVEELHFYSRYDNKTFIDLNGRFIVGEGGYATFNFGKYRGLRAKDFKDYLLWMLTEEANFTTDVKSVAQAIFNREIK